MARGGRTLRTLSQMRNAVGPRVRERRQALHLTQDALNGRIAAITGAVWNPRPQEILHLERGTRLVTDLELLVLAKALESSTLWLLTGSDTEPSEQQVMSLFLLPDSSEGA